VYILNNHKDELLIHISWKDINNGDNQCQEIKKELDKIKGVKRSFFTKNSSISNIAVFAEWIAKDIPSRINEIRKIKNVKDVDVEILTPL
jgi:hypothetical protein